MTVAFVSGDIGSGKSSFCEALQGLGATWISSDGLVAEIYRKDPTVIAELETALGQNVRDPSGELNRSVLAAAIFSDSAARSSVEAIVHPRVQRMFQEKLSAAATALVVYEVTALKTTTDTSAADVICEVVAQPEVRIERLLAKGYTRDEAAARIAAQLNDTSRRHDVDVIVDNSGSIEDLHAAAQRLYAQWVSARA